MTSDSLINMDSRLADMPVMAQRADAIEASLFNLWRRARARFGNTIRLDHLGLKQVAAVLTDRYWVCVDVVQNDCPIVAWVDFHDSGRDTLHEPIGCKINYYHFAASALRARALERIADLLDQKIQETRGQ